MKIGSYFSTFLKCLWGRSLGVALNLALKNTCGAKFKWIFYIPLFSGVRWRDTGSRNKNRQEKYVHTLGLVENIKADVRPCHHALARISTRDILEYLLALLFRHKPKGSGA